MAFADFVPPQPYSGFVGAIQGSVSGAEAWGAEFDALKDAYSSLLCRAVANVLTEALAEKAHSCADSLWPLGACKSIRPAIGYPGLPEHAEKRTLFRLLDAPKHTGASLTSTCMMQPAASVCAILLHHPKARYFPQGG